MLHKLAKATAVWCIHHREPSISRPPPWLPLLHLILHLNLPTSSRILLSALCVASLCVATHFFRPPLFVWPHTVWPHILNPKNSPPFSGGAISQKSPGGTFGVRRRPGFRRCLRPSQGRKNQAENHRAGERSRTPDHRYRVEHYDTGSQLSKKSTAANNQAAASSADRTPPEQQICLILI